MGGGKSRWLCEHINDHMMRYPGNRGFIGRKQFSDFKISTYLTLGKVLEQLIQTGR